MAFDQLLVVRSQEKYQTCYAKVWGQSIIFALIVCLSALKKDIAVPFSLPCVHDRLNVCQRIYTYINFSWKRVSHKLINQLP